MADFAHIQSVQTVVGEGGKALLQLRVAGSQELLQVREHLDSGWLMQFGLDIGLVGCRYLSRSQAEKCFYRLIG